MACRAACFGLALWTSAIHAAALGEPYFESVGASEDAPDQNVTVIAPDPDGFLWVGMPSGLFRYDGYRFRRLEHPDGPSLGSAFIRALVFDRQGRLWIGTDADGLFVFDPGRGSLRQFLPEPGRSDSLSHNSVMALAGDKDGELWVGTRVGLDRLRAGATTFEHLRSGPRQAADGKESRILSLLVDPENTLWIGSWNGLNRRDHRTGAIERVEDSGSARGSLSGKLVLSLYDLDDGSLVVGTARDGAFRVSADGQEVEPINVPETIEGVRGDPMVLSILQPVPDEIWLAGFGGIVVVSKNEGRLLRFMRHDVAVNSSLGHSQVRTMIQDDAGQIWIGGYGGRLQRHDPHNRGIRMLRHSPSRVNALSSPNVTSILELANQRLWIGTRDNGIDVLDRSQGVIDGIRADPRQPSALASASIGSLAQTADGTVWVGTVVGLQRLDPETHHALPFEAPPALRDATIRRLLLARSGDLWIGSNVGLARWRVERNAIELISTVGGDILSGDINALVEAEDGRLWVGCGAAGLYTLAPGEVQLQQVALRVGTTPAPLSIVGLLMSRSGVLWIDTSQGLYRLTQWQAGQGRVEDVSTPLGLAGYPLGANLLEDGSGRIWTQRFVFDPHERRVFELTAADGADLGTPWFRSYAKTNDGHFLFGGSKGLLVVDPTQFRPWSTPAPLRITDVRLDSHSGQTWAPPQSLWIASESRAFSVEFAALDFSAPRKTTYQYRLAGFDPNWIDQDADRRTADYGVVPPGDYMLEIRARSRNGIDAANVLRLPVQIEAAYWQTMAFKGIVFLTIAVLLYFLYRWRVAAIRANERHLTETVERRTRELSLAKEQSERAYHELRGAQQQLVIAEKMASLGGLVAGVAHEINTPLGVGVTAASHLNEVLMDFERRTAPSASADQARFTTLARQCTDMILRNLDRADKLVKSFKQVAVDQSSEQLRDVALATCLEDILTSMQASLKRTPHRVTIDCPSGLHLMTDPGAIYQIMANLIMNSLTHGLNPESPGEITIVASAVAAKADGRTMILLVYRDNGCGMTPEVRRLVFEPFFTTKRGAGGTGLGMHITFNLVTQRLKGTIECTSTLGSGVQFDILIPRNVHSDLAPVV